MGKEAGLETKLREAVKRLGGWAVKFWPLSIIGFPDRMVLMPGGRIYFVEMKAPGKTPNDIQKAVHAKLLRLGFPVYLVDGKIKLDNFLLLIQA